MNSTALKKYRPFAFGPKLTDRRWPDQQLVKAPIWCSVDLRDGNQSLPIPMNVAEKLEFFRLLVAVGFKEIEIGFPSASDTEFAFTRELIEKNLIPNDVTVQVLVQCREHLIDRTVEALKGAKNVIIHIYNSTSPLQREITFSGATKDSIKQIAVEGAKMVKARVDRLPGTKVRLQYSPESFSDTEVEFSLEVCEAVMAVWQPTEKNPIILNLPDTVQWTTPNVHADQIEWFCRNMKDRKAAIISLHTHNDRGTGVAATELGLMAGADRVEGTLFGNGERTGNLDIVTVALNLYTHGVEPKLDFTDLPRAREIYERTTRMTVPDRHPYAGDLVFTAFSGSHQDAIKKGMDLRGKKSADANWEVPYLTIDPVDVGASYEAIVRINSQSGKGGIAYILGRDFGYDLPKLMHPEVGSLIGAESDKQQLQRELSPKEIRDHFRKFFVNIAAPTKLVSFDAHAITGEAHAFACTAKIEQDGKPLTISGKGNGPINAFVHALAENGLKKVSLKDYRSHALGGDGSASESAAYVCVERDADGQKFWGCGVDTNIELAGLLALVSAMNRAAQ
jgi:2-isopropylmalate synthase